MIIFVDKSYQSCTDYPDTDFSGGEAVYIVPDNTILAHKIVSYYPDYEVITDDSGEVVDVIQTAHIITVDERRQQIIQLLADIDAAEIRPLAAIGAGISTDEDTARLAELENKKRQLRTELAGMEQNNG